MLGQDQVQNDSNPASAVGIATSEYANLTRRLIGLITKLRALGAQTDFDLPRIAVIGNQSAGKSSLVEAISGVRRLTLNIVFSSNPRATPFMVIDNGSTSKRDLHKILLRMETDDNGRPLLVKKEVPFGLPILERSHLEEMIRRAQLAILNPSVSAENFLDFDTGTLAPGELPLGSTRQLSFSSNVVCLDLSGPDLTDLSFIDLPGLISNVALGEDRGNIEAVRRMVREHIQGQTLILLTITMRGTYGEHDAWLRVLEGTSKHNLQLGYFVTKQPSPKELEEGVTFEEARRREHEFFAHEAPWRDQSHLEPRMGTKNLTRALSNLLARVINDGLPQLRLQSKQAFQEVNEALIKLPPPPSENPAAELLRLVTGFSGDVDRLIAGSQSFEDLIRLCRPAYTRFKNDIRATAPDFRPFKNEHDPLIDPLSNMDQRVKVIIEDDDEENDVPAARPMYLSDVRQHIKSSITRELPFNVPFRAKVTLIENFFEEWHIFCDACFESVHLSASEQLAKLVRKHFGQMVATGLYDHVSSIVEAEIERAREKAKERIKWMLALEYPPFTLNDHYFSSYREKYLTKYRKARRPELFSMDMMKTALAALANVGFSGVKEDDLYKLNEWNSYEQELIVMAETSAYFHVSYKVSSHLETHCWKLATHFERSQRIIDNIPRIINHDFLGTISQEIQGALIKGLSLGTERGTERASMYLSEGEEVRVRRKELASKKQRLEGVLNALYQFGM
ncbi:hypothetical protein NLI96_g4541 [Meripilus lineatus]|uniref:GED domain-containing protein n=1 Tax=Meripilus lineatus TaxID=2056292 RepID=A0AAD5V6D9_9APHY|nr:hypothetical protein NLI96_g4541 [Physisporinus lineatus]